MYVHVSPLVLHQTFEGVLLLSRMRFLGTETSWGIVACSVGALRSGGASEVAQVDQTSKLSARLLLWLLNMILIHEVAISRAAELLLLRSNLRSELSVLVKNLSAWLLVELRLRSILIDIDSHVHSCEHVSLPWDLALRNLA